MSWLDFVIIVTWGLGVIVGWRMGLFGAIFTTVGLIVGVLLAARLSDNVSALITNSVASDTVATVVAYGIILFAVFVAAQLLRFMVKGIKGAIKMTPLGWVDSLGGVALGLVMGVVLSGALITVLARYSSDLPVEGWIEKTPGGGKIWRGFDTTDIARSRIQEKLNTALVESTLVPVFLDIRSAIPGDALGFVPDDFKVALDVLEAEIDRQ